MKVNVCRNFTTAKSRPVSTKEFSVVILLTLLITSAVLSAGFNSRVIDRRAFGVSSSFHASSDYNSNVCISERELKQIHITRTKSKIMIQ